MLLDIKQLWQQDVSHVEDMVQVQESESSLSIPDTSGVCQKLMPADETTKRETEHRFDSSLCPESTLRPTVSQVKQPMIEFRQSAQRARSTPALKP